MTLTLAIDTATSRTIVGIIDGDNVLFEEFHEGATDHGRALSELVARALKVSRPPQQVVVGMGPGPFTGLRVGISFAVCANEIPTRNIPVIGVCSLDAIVVDQSEYTVAIDARRKEIYWARYTDGARIEGPSVNKPADVQGFIMDRYPDMKKLVSLSTSQSVTEPMYLRRPDAVPTAERS
jgi:tRNA threonylcarbamoyl adenosine modification protein YeaZ